MTPTDALWSVDELITRCTHDDPRLRSWAVERVGKLGGAAALPTLLRALDDADADVLISALKAIEALGDAAAPAVLREPLRRIARNEALPPGPREMARQLLVIKRDAEGIEAAVDLCRHDEASTSLCRLLAKHAPERLHALAVELGLLARPGHGPIELVVALPRVITIDELPAAYAALRVLTRQEDREHLCIELLRPALAESHFTDAPASSKVIESLLDELSAAFIYDNADAHVERWLSPAEFSQLIDGAAERQWRSAVAWCAAWCAEVADDDPDGAWGRALLQLLGAEAHPDERHVRVAAALALAASVRAIDREVPFDASSLEERLARSCDAPELVRESRWAAVEAAWRALPEGDDDVRAAVSDELANILETRDGLAVTRAIELAARLPGLAVPPRALTDLPELEADYADALVRCLSAQPASLRELAPKALAHDDSTVHRVALEALGNQNERWASALLAEHFERLLTHRSADAVFDAVEQLGDVSLLPQVVAAWRPGEQMVATTAVRLARLGAQESTLPPGLLSDADNASATQRNLLAKMLSPGGLDELSSMIGDKPLSVELVCNQCKRTAHYETGTATVHPDLERCKRDGWDGVVFERVIVCKYCGAEDDYTLGTMALFSIMAGAMKAMMEGRAPTPADLNNARLRLGVPGLSDGTHIRRASDGLRHWETKLARNPSDADAWLRLGNLQRQQHRIDATVDSYRRSIALRPTHVETLGALLETLVEAGRGDEGSELPGKILAALPRSGATTPVRETVALLVVEFARLAVENGQPLALMAGWPGREVGKQLEVNVSSLDLRRVTCWDRLAEFIAHPSVVMMSLKGAEPEDIESRLETLIEGDGPLGLVGGRVGETQTVRAAPKIGRNDPCHCGSGKKYKKCHG